MDVLTQFAVGPLTFTLFILYKSYLVSKYLAIKGSNPLNNNQEIRDLEERFYSEYHFVNGMLIASIITIISQAIFYFVLSNTTSFLFSFLVLIISSVIILIAREKHLRKRIWDKIGD